MAGLFTLQYLAEQHARDVLNGLRGYQRLLPNNSVPAQFGTCRGDGRDVAYDTLNIDCALDQPLADRLIREVIANAESSPKPMLPKGAKLDLGDGHSWLFRYLHDEPLAQTGTGESAGAAKLTKDALIRAKRLIAEGAKSVKINP